MAGKIKGKYKPRNYKKYRGNPTNIEYRSSWELQMMRMMDLNENILEWSSEEIAIGYKHPIKGSFHRYYPDFFCKKRKKDGTIVMQIIEIKPEHEAVPPTRKAGQKTSTYLRRVATYAVNKAKWEAARRYCRKHNYEFEVWTKDKNEQFQILNESVMGLEQLK